jgi:hypothetical protein
MANGGVAARRAVDVIVIRMNAVAHDFFSFFWMLRRSLDAPLGESPARSRDRLPRVAASVVCQRGRSPSSRARCYWASPSMPGPRACPPRRRQSPSRRSPETRVACHPMNPCPCPRIRPPESWCGRCLAPAAFESRPRRSRSSSPRSRGATARTWARYVASNTIRHFEQSTQSVGVGDSFRVRVLDGVIGNARRAGPTEGTVDDERERRPSDIATRTAREKSAVEQSVSRTGHAHALFTASAELR